MDKFNINNEFNGSNINEHLKHIRSCCRKYVKDPEELKMLESEVIEKVWKKRDDFYGTHNEFQGWVFTITKNTYINMYKKAQFRNYYDLNSMSNKFHAAFDIEKYIDDKNQIQDIFHAIENTFNKGHVKVFKANVLDGKKYEECAKEFGYTLGTVKVVIHNIRKHLLTGKRLRYEY
jgi:RNA polymerase sigma factor (sigma-70 family)